jgi:hypothetical protein
MVKFAPREKKPGDLIRSEEWNQIQRDIHEDLTDLEDGVLRAESRPAVLVARGIASHEVYVQLGWDVQPQVFTRLLYVLGEAGGGGSPWSGEWDVGVDELSPSGFRVRAVRGDLQETGAVEWVALGVR